MDKIDTIDRRILNIIQNDFPVSSSPFVIIAEQTGISEDEALERVKRLKERGIIRRIGAVFDLRKLGFTSTLCAARVPEEKVASFVSFVNDLKGVTHNYRRAGDYNIWFTLIAASEEELTRVLNEITAATEISDIMSMKATRVFKINAAFPL